MSPANQRAYLLVEEGGQLVDETLARARGQEGETGLARDDPLDGLLLLAS